MTKTPSATAFLPVISALLHKKTRLQPDLRRALRPTMIIPKAAGVIPSIRLACPKVTGLIVLSLTLSSLESPGILL